MSKRPTPDSLGARATLETPHGKIIYYRLERLAEAGLGSIARLPLSIKVLLEAVVRAQDHGVGTAEDVARLAGYDPASPDNLELAFTPARVLLQDFTGVPCMVDLAAMRSAMARLGGDPSRINPHVPVDLVIDHSIQVDVYNSAEAFERNGALELTRNRERYEFLRWGQGAFEGFRVLPPNRGICHQVNLEFLATVVQRRDEGGEVVAFPDSLVGTDSHTPMVNGLGVVGWGVGGIEAEAVMLGQPLHMLAPAVVGVRLKGRLPPGSVATDLVLTVTERLRRQGVVGQFVEFFGEGLSTLTVPDRATVSNMAPEYGAMMGYFPVDDQTLRYLSQTGRPGELVDLVERYCKAQGLFGGGEPEFQRVVEVDLGEVEPCMAGPKRPQDRVALGEMGRAWRGALRAPVESLGFGLSKEEVQNRTIAHLPGGDVELTHGAVAIAAITSCTNTSNPTVLLAAGLLARKAVEAGLTTKTWVKTSLAPGSMVVTQYLQETGLAGYLERLGFFLVGYGCTTCIGNSGPLPDEVAKAVTSGGLVVASVLSGNRNFEGRINPLTRASFLASPPLVVAYALAGTVDRDLLHDPLGHNDQGRAIYLKDIWPRPEEIEALVGQVTRPELFWGKYKDIEGSSEEWNAVPLRGGVLYDWNKDSTYIQEPPFFQDMGPEGGSVEAIRGARVLVMVGDSLTTDHISPAGPIPADGPAGRYLREQGVGVEDFNSFGSRRGNDRVMARGTFGSIRLRNQLVPGREGGWTIHLPSGEVMPIYEAAQRYLAEGRPTVVLGGKDYGMGSSRDWAAKGTRLLGVRAVLAESFESIHRSNLVNMGVLPLALPLGQSPRSLGLTGRETYTIHLSDDLAPGQEIHVEALSEDGGRRSFEARCGIQIPMEVAYYRDGGILPHVLRRFLSDQFGV